MTVLVVLAEHERLCLRDRISQQQFVVVGQVVRGLFHDDEFHGYNVCALVQHLKIRMLPVGARLAPQHG